MWGPGNRRFERGHPTRGRGGGDEVFESILDPLDRASGDSMQAMTRNRPPH